MVVLSLQKKKWHEFDPYGILSLHRERVFWINSNPHQPTRSRKPSFPTADITQTMPILSDFNQGRHNSGGSECAFNFLPVLPHLRISCQDNPPIQRLLILIDACLSIVWHFGKRPLRSSGSSGKCYILWRDGKYPWVASK